MLNSTILLASEPHGIFLEGIVSGTPYPGTVMEIQNATAPINGEFTWQVYGTNAGMSDADPRLRAVLLEDKLQGFSYVSPYVAGQKCFLYCPIPGEMMNMMVAGQVGTGSANAFTIGERFIPHASTGLLIKESTSATIAPFMCLEHIDLTPDQQGLVWCMYTGW